MSITTSRLTLLPAELVELVARHLDHDSDVNALCQAHSSLYRAANAFLYRRNIRHGSSFALFYGALAGNTANITRALAYGALSDTVYKPEPFDVRMTRAHAALRLPVQSQPRVPPGWDRYTRHPHHHDYTPLACAALYGRVAAARLLLDCGAAADTPMSADVDSTPLHIAASLGHVPFIELLLEPGRPEYSKYSVQQFPRYRTPLYLAIAAASIEAATALIRHGADLAELDHDQQGHDSFYEAFADMPDQGRFEDMVELLLAHKVWDKPTLSLPALLSEVAAVGQIDKARWLLARGLVQIDTRPWIDPRGPGWLPPLLRAAASGQAPMVEYLLRNGADPTQQTTYTETALILAAYWTHLAVVKILLEWDGAPHQHPRLIDVAPTQGMIGWTALHSAISGTDGGRANVPRRTAIIKLLVGHGANLELRTRVQLPGYTPLLLQLQLCRNNDLFSNNDDGPDYQCVMTERLELLLDAGADTKARCDNGRTALSFAASEKCPACTRALLARIGHQRAADDELAADGQNAWDWAKSCGWHGELAALVEEQRLRELEISLSVRPAAPGQAAQA
ncbi:serine/threonine-protein phosphatase 6 regulatory ankyrin repeat subunit B [Microdochium nivale]|nr:serine/threonine-protein phosphatase 6 regulatory ankyrin repeat subunit B [Microdochium nivale]